MSSADETSPSRITNGIPPHLDGWQLPPGWRWGDTGVQSNYRHAQEIVDRLGRSLALVTAPEPAHHTWLFHEARQLAHRNHPSIPTTYHFWERHQGSRRGPGYLRRWIAGETVAAISRGPTEPSMTTPAKAGGNLSGTRESWALAKMFCSERRRQ